MIVHTFIVNAPNDNFCNYIKELPGTVHFYLKFSDWFYRLDVKNVKKKHSFLISNTF